LGWTSAFAVRLGATNTQIGLLTSIPALLAVLISIPAGRFLMSRRRQKPWILSALVLHRSGFLLVALLPWLNLFHIPLGVQVIFVLIGISIPVHFFNVGWIPMLAEVTSENRRAAIFSARNIVFNAALTVFVFLFGQWLDRVRFPLNYQVMFIFGYFTSFMSLYYLIRLEIPEKAASEQEIISVVEKSPRFSLRQTISNLRQWLTDHPGFLHIMVNTFLHGIGLWVATPLYILYYVRFLGASDAWIGLQGTIASGGTILGYLFWRWVISRWGEYKVLRYTIVCIGLYPLLVGQLHSLTLILFAVALNSLLSPGVNLAHFNTLLKVIPPESRPAYTAMYIAFVNIGIFIFPMVGVFLADRISLGISLTVCGICSILGSTSFWFWPVIRETNRQPDC
jgi:hypothetical protein